MPILNHTISRADLAHCPEDAFFPDIVKAVVDVDRHLLAIDAEMHADLQALLLNDGSNLTSLWGITLSRDPEQEDFITYDAWLNLRVYQGNRSCTVEDPALREKIREVVAEWIRG